MGASWSTAPNFLRLWPCSTTAPKTNALAACSPCATVTVMGKLRVVRWPSYSSLWPGIVLGPWRRAVEWAAEEAAAFGDETELEGISEVGHIQEGQRVEVKSAEEGEGSTRGSNQFDVRVDTRVGPVHIVVSREQLLTQHAMALSKESVTAQLVDAAIAAAAQTHDGTISQDESVSWGQASGGIVKDLVNVFAF